jgi:hypothetical protein
LHYSSKLFLSAAFIVALVPSAIDDEKEQYLMAAQLVTARWPELDYAAWKDTRDTLHLWTQVVGKVRLALTPWLNHSWHVALYITARGLTTSPILWRGGNFQVDFDFIDHVLWIRLSEGQFRQVMLKPMSVAEFYEDIMIALRELGIESPIKTMPCEIADCIPFEQDTVHAAYDADYANRFWRVLLAAQEVFAHFRTGFLGKTSPVHFFWGSFDLAVTRFSGRRAPLYEGTAPGVTPIVMQEAYSHEVSSAGFWPGGAGVDASFYSYAYPEPPGFKDAPVAPAIASYSDAFREFLLPYEVVRTASDPDAVLLAFLQSTYEAAANAAHWDRAALECEPGRAGVCRHVP